MEFRSDVERYISNAITDDATIMPVDILYAMLDELDYRKHQIEELKEIMRDQSFEREYRRD